jgi:hypothetical protein
MAYPSDTRNPPDVSTAPLRARLTPEEADRLAALFRPSWELDDVSFVAPTMVSPQSVRASQGDGTRADVRAAGSAANGAHGPAPAAPASNQQPESSVIIESSDILPASGANAPSPRMQVTHTLVLPNPIGNAPLRHAPPAAIAARTVPFTAPQRIATSLEMAEVGQADFIKPARKSSVGLWLGIGVAAASVIGIGIWLGSSSEEKHPAAPTVSEKPHTAAPAIPAPPPPPPVETVAVQPTASPAPPPPPPPLAAPPPTPAAAQLAAVVAAAAPPAAPQPTPAAPAAPTPRLYVPPAPQRPTWIPPVTRAPAAPPPARAAKPSAPTIVRDTPF